MAFLRRKTFRARPIPEILDGENWEVRNSGDVTKAYIDFKTREFVVPFEESPAGELVRAHEAMHVKISPHEYIKKEKTDFITLQSVEDCRVWQGLRLAGIQTDNSRARIYTDKELKKIFSESEEIKNPQRMAEALIATTGTNEYQTIKELVNQMDPTGKVIPVVEELTEKYFTSNERNNDNTTWEEVVECCDELIERLKEEIPEFEPPPQGNDGSGEEGEKMPGDQRGNITFSYQPGQTSEDIPESLGSLTEEEYDEAAENGLEYSADQARAFKDQFHYRNEFKPPGKLKPIEKPRLDQVIRFKTTNSVKMTPSDEGTIPTRMHRYATDMKLFSRKGRRRAGAAVLIDVSGSMSLSSDMLLDIIKQCPASIVAIYSARGGKEGTLRIVAENGRYSSDLNKGMGGSNIVDIPAIEWLSKRKESKKLWISDGWITTEHESMAFPEDIRKLSNLMRVKKIERVGNVRELLKSGKLIDHAFDDGHELGRNFG